MHGQQNITIGNVLTRIYSKTKIHEDAIGWMTKRVGVKKKSVRDLICAIQRTKI